MKCRPNKQLDIFALASINGFGLGLNPLIKIKGQNHRQEFISGFRLWAIAFHNYSCILANMKSQDRIQRIQALSTRYWRAVRLRHWKAANETYVTMRELMTKQLRYEIRSAQ